MPVLNLHDRPCIILRTDPGMTLIGRGGTVDGACLPARRGVCTPGCADPFDRLWHLFADPTPVTGRSAMYSRRSGNVATGTITIRNDASIAQALASVVNLEMWCAVWFEAPERDRPMHHCRSLPPTI